MGLVSGSTNPEEHVGAPVWAEKRNMKIIIICVIADQWANQKTCMIQNEKEQKMRETSSERLLMSGNQMSE